MLMCILTALALTALTAGPGAAAPAPAATPYATFNVAPDGNDKWSGRLARPNAARTDGPFATITRARDAVRALKARDGGLKGPVTVRIAGGTYRIPETLVFGYQDSGTTTAPITYTALPGAKPVISGGRPITGWQKGADGLWTTRIPEVAQGQWYFRQLFVNGRRATRARTPNEGYFRTEGPNPPLVDREAARRDNKSKTGFRFREGDLKQFANLEDANIMLYHAWTSSWHHVAEVNTQERTVRLSSPSGWPVGWWEKEQRYILENVPEALDAPGEWYLDRKTGVLSYKPLPGEDMSKAQVVAPVLRTLVRFVGDSDLGLWVENIHLQGLSFQHADWSITPDKTADGQAAVFLRNAAITGDGAIRCSLEKCEIAHVGEHAVWFKAGCQNNRFVQNYLHDLGSGGIYIGDTARPATPAMRTMGNLVHNNFIHTGGRVFEAGIGVWVGQSSHNKITHNEISDLYYSGMSLGWTWGYGPSEANHNIVEYNHIHHIGQGVLSDMGGIYCLGISPGTVLRNNYIHDVLSYSYGGWGLYTDEGSTGILMENNVVCRTKSGGFHQHYGRDNVLKNNIFATASEGEIIRSRQEPHISFTLEGNIIYQTMGPLLGGNWGNGNFRMSRNLYWHTKGENDFTDLTLEEWREENGQDKDSLVADPLFVNPERDDFRLKPGSPAAKIGFKPIDLSRVGLQGDKAWVDAPKRLKLAPAALPAPVVRMPVGDDYEQTAVGEKPANAGVSGEDLGASIRVTNETAASGKQSLKIVDAPGLSHEWQPHLVYRPTFTRGKVRVAFDLRVEKGAIAWIEMRDAGGDYKAGPSLKFQGDRVLVNDKPLQALPAGEWMHVEITCTLGREANGTFDLKIVPQGGKPLEFPALEMVKKDFRKFQYLGFISLATDKSVFYLDNVKVEAIK